MAEIWLIRHGETEWSKSLRHTGRTDIELTDAGRDEARALEPRLAGVEFARVLRSPLRRATDTCELAGRGDGSEPRDELMELDYGDYEGLTTAEIRETVPGWTMWSHGAAGGETVTDAGLRLDPLIAELSADPDADGDVALFAHGHILRVFAARWLEEDASFGKRLALATGTLSRLGWEREARCIRLWNG